MHDHRNLFREPARPIALNLLSTCRCPLRRAAGRGLQDGQGPSTVKVRRLEAVESRLRIHGTVLATSDGPLGNTGFPSSFEEKNTSKKFSTTRPASSRRRLVRLG
jgi:hypothetical protein